MNDYLKIRNKTYFCETIYIPHSKYKEELNDALQYLNFFIYKSVITRGIVLRKKYLYSYSAEHCWKKNNFTYSESEMCEEQLFSKDRVLNEAESFMEELKIDIADEYEKKVSQNQLLEMSSQKEITYETLHRNFLIKMHLWYRFYYYYLGRSIFVNAAKLEN